MIKLRNVGVSKGEVTLTFDYDIANEKTTRSIDISKADIDEQIKAIKNATGQNVSETDIKNIIRKFVDDARSGNAKISEQYDYSKLLNVNLEESAKTA